MKISPSNWLTALMYVTRHLSELLETGEMRYKDETRLWIAKDIEGRDDNLVCAAVTLGQSLIVKTVMHRFQWES